MAKIIFLKPAEMGKVHPDASKRINDWQVKISHDVPQMGDVSQERFTKDIIKFLSHEELKLLRDTKVKVNHWLKDHFKSESYYVSPFGPEIDQYMSMIIELLKAIYQRKEQANKNKRQKAATAVRRRQRLAAMQPQILEAKAYLNSDQCKLFEDSIPGAVDAWLELGSAYATDARAFNFMLYMEEARRRREQKKLLQTAQAEAEKYNFYILKEIEKLKSALSHIKDPVEYFKKTVIDPRYLGYEFSGILDEDELRNTNDKIQKMIDQKLKNLIATDLTEYIDSKYNAYLFLLPSASYIFSKIPCLNFGFDVFAVVSTEIWLKAVKKTFDGYDFTLPWISEKSNAGHSAQEPERLGYQYYLLTPTDLGSIQWEIVPLSLIKSLWDDEIEAKGVSILEASEEVIIYQVEGFEDEIWLPSIFADYIKELGNIDKMIEASIVSKKAADIVIRKLEQLDAVKTTYISNNQPSAASVVTTDKITKKILAYQLFGKGNVPTSPAVKALGLHKSTRCKYYNQWLADGKPDFPGICKQPA